MALKTFNPTTPSRRQLVIVDRSELWKGKPVKALTEGLRGNGGRNNTGRTTMRWRGGGNKRRYRIVDFKRSKVDVPATVERLEYDPNRTAFIALIRYQDGELAYILAPQRLKAGDTVLSGERVDVKPGNTMPMRSMPVGTIIHNVEMKPGKGGQIARSAGTYAQLVGRDQGYALLRMASGEVRMVRSECRARQRVREKHAQRGRKGDCSFGVRVSAARSGGGCRSDYFRCSLKNDSVRSHNAFEASASYTSGRVSLKNA